MKKTAENQLSMLYAVLAICAKYASTWAGLLSFKKAHDELVANVGSVVEASKTQETDITGMALDKRFKRDAMVVATLDMAKRLFAYADEEGDIVLRQKVNIGERDLLRLRDSVIAQLSLGVHDLALGLVANLADYGVEAADVTAFKAKIDAYVAVISSPRTATTVRKGATAEIDALMKDCMKILNNRMDNVIPEFKTSAPSFYQEYFDARIVIDNTGTKKGKDDITPEAPEAPEAAAA